MRNRNEHSGSEKPDAAFLGISDEEPATFAGKLGLECSKNFVKSGMHHTAVEAGCLLTGGFVLLDARYGESLLGQLACNRAADNAAGSYDADIEHRSGKSVKIPSTPSLREREISSSPFTVQMWTRSLAWRAAAIRLAVTRSLRG